MDQIFNKIIANEYKTVVDHGKAHTEYDPFEFSGFEPLQPAAPDLKPSSFSGTKKLKNQLAGKKAQQPKAKFSRDRSNLVRDFYTDK